MIVTLQNVDSRASLWACFSDALKVGFGRYENWGQFEEAILTQLEDNPLDPLYVVHTGIFSVPELDCQKYMTVLNLAAEEYKVYVCFDLHAYEGDILLREISTSAHH